MPGDQSKAVGGGQPAGAVGQAFGQSFSQPLRTQTRPATTVRGLDRQAPRVRLNARVDRRRQRLALRWSATDLGGSGIARYYLQLRRRGGGWRTLAVTGRRSYVFRTHAPGVYSFRVRAVDGAGNASAWAAKRVALARH